MVNAVRDLGRVGKGGSHSHFFSCDDGNEYLVKFAAPAPNKTVINELVGGALALLLNLPAPEIALVQIPPSIVALSDLQRRGIAAGLHLGIRRLPRDCWDFDTLPPDFLGRNTLINVDQLYGVITFDNWLLNTDRNNSGNNMLQLLPKNQMRYVMIDFGHCFGGDSWNESLAGQEDNNNLMPFFPYFLGHINRLTNFEAWFMSLERLPDSEIESVLSRIPTTWSLTAGEKQVLLNLIKHRRYLPRSIIIANRSVLRI